MSSFKEAFAEIRSEAYWRYQREERKANQHEEEVNKVFAELKEKGIVLLDSTNVSRIFEMTKLDIYKEMEAWCKRVNRPYVKCAQASYSRIVVAINGTGRERQLVSQLLFVAEPLKPSTGYSRKSKKYVTQTPDLFAGDGYETPSQPVSSWVTPRTISIMFQDAEGKRQFEEWYHFTTTDRMQRFYLGL